MVGTSDNNQHETLRVDDVLAASRELNPLSEGGQFRSRLNAEGGCSAGGNREKCNSAHSFSWRLKSRTSCFLLIFDKPMRAMKSPRCICVNSFGKLIVASCAHQSECDTIGEIDEQSSETSSKEIGEKGRQK